jgi:hypothetical protein
MNHPFFNPKNMSDDELTRKQQEVAKRIFDAYSIGLSFDIVQQLRMISESLETEREERSAREMFDVMNSTFPEIIETDKEWLSEADKLKASRPSANINDIYIPENFKKEKVEKINDRQQQFKTWQEQQRKSINNQPTGTERVEDGTPPPPKRRGRPKKIKIPGDNNVPG